MLINRLVCITVDRTSARPTLFTLLLKTTLSPQGLAAGRYKVDPMLQVLWNLRGLHLRAAKHKIVVIYCQWPDSYCQTPLPLLPSFYTGAARSCRDCCVSHSACSTWRHTPVCLFWTQTSAPGKRLCRPKWQSDCTDRNPLLYTEPCGSEWLWPPPPGWLWGPAPLWTHRFARTEKSGQSRTPGGSEHCSCGTCRCRVGRRVPLRPALLWHPTPEVETRPAESQHRLAGSTTHPECWRETLRQQGPTPTTTSL